MSLFSLKELTPPATPDPATDKGARAEKLRLKFESVHLQKINNIKDLIGAYPQPAEAYFLFTLKSFNAFTFIVYIIKHVGPISELCISTYSLNLRILSSLLKWYDRGEIKSIKLCISDSIRHRMPKVYDLIELQKKQRNMEVVYSWNHSKITLMQSEDHHFVVEGSGNFSENAMHEQYLFMNSSELYHFRRDCIMSLQQATS